MLVAASRRPAPIVHCILRSPALIQRHRFSIASLFNGRKKQLDTAASGADPSNRFFNLSESPAADLRQHAATIKSIGVCPVCDAAGNKTRPVYECPGCGYPSHCSEAHHRADANHAANCRVLREINENEHDLRLRKSHPEFDMPGPQGYEEAINLSNWSTLFYTRKFQGIADSFGSRHVTKLLTYPMTIASLLHTSSPYRLGASSSATAELTPAGLRTLSWLRGTLRRQSAALGNSAESSRRVSPAEPVRVIIPGARAESMLPLDAWVQLSAVFPSTPFNVVFAGPDASYKPVKRPAADAVHGEMANNVFVRRPHSRLAFTHTEKSWDAFHHQLEPYDPATDVFFLFSPGLGHQSSRKGWVDALRKMIDTKCGIFITGFSDADMRQDVAMVQEEFSGEIDWLLHPGENPFRSLKADVNPEDLREMAWTNWGIFGIRGKRYDVTMVDEDED